MQVIHGVAELRARLAREASIVLVPTMGNLHAGHIALVDAARQHGRCVVVTIGIGAGPDVSGQVLVNYDMLGIFPGRKARFVRNFMEGAPSVQAAIEAYVKAVKDRSYPAPEHCF